MDSLKIRRHDFLGVLKRDKHFQKAVGKGKSRRHRMCANFGNEIVTGT